MSRRASLLTRTLVPLGLSGALVVAPACGSSSGSDGRGDAFGGAGGTAASTGAGATAGTAATAGTGGTTPTGGTSGTGATGGLIGTGGTGTGGMSAGGMAGAAGTGVGGTGAVGGCGAPPPDVSVPEVCSNGLDDDLDGFIDENCPCSLAQQQPCFGGPPSQANAPNCVMGTQTCEGTAEFPGWGACNGWMCDQVPPPPEVCDNQMDDDCDGQVDEGCALEVAINIDGDCIAVPCPPQAPHPSGCDITMEGGDSRGCVANASGNPAIYFQEGDACPIPGLPFGDSGNVTGTLFCSTQPLPPGPSGNPLNGMNCVINKAAPCYPNSAGGCIPCAAP